MTERLICFKYNETISLADTDQIKDDENNSGIISIPIKIFNKYIKEEEGVPKFIIEGENNLFCCLSSKFHIIDSDNICFLPSWVFNKLFLYEGQEILLEHVSYNIEHCKDLTLKSLNDITSKFIQKNEINFILDVLSQGFDKYPIITSNDILSFEYENKLHEFLVVNSNPLISFMKDTDINLIFEEDQVKKKEEEPLKKEVNKISQEQIKSENILIKKYDKKWGKIADLKSFSGKGNKMA